jgi:hypothetical protein
VIHSVTLWQLFDKVNSQFFRLASCLCEFSFAIIKFVDVILKIRQIYATAKDKLNLIEAKKSGCRWLHSQMDRRKAEAFFFAPSSDLQTNTGH